MNLDTRELEAEVRHILLENIKLACLDMRLQEDGKTEGVSVYRAPELRT